MKALKLQCIGECDIIILISQVLKKNKELKSDKKDRGEHGYGMKTIKEIVEKYEGLMDIWEEAGKFCIGIVLYIDK